MIPRRHRRRAPRPARPRRPRELGGRVRPTQSVRNGLMFIGQDPPPEERCTTTGAPSCGERSPDSAGVNGPARPRALGLPGARPTDPESLPAPARDCNGTGTGGERGCGPGPGRSDCGTGMEAPRSSPGPFEEEEPSPGPQREDAPGGRSGQARGFGGR